METYPALGCGRSVLMVWSLQVPQKPLKLGLDWFPWNLRNKFGSWKMFELGGLSRTHASKMNLDILDGHYPSFKNKRILKNRQFQTELLCLHHATSLCLYVCIFTTKCPNIILPNKNPNCKLDSSQSLFGFIWWTPWSQKINNHDASPYFKEDRRTCPLASPANFIISL